MEEQKTIVAYVSNFANPKIEIVDEPWVGKEVSTSVFPTFPSLYSLYRWAFPSESHTKIDVVRRVIRETFSKTPVITVSQVQERGNAIFQAAEATFAIVCRRAFNAYLRSREEMERDTQAFLAETHQRVAALGDEVLNTSLQFFTGALALAVANLFHQDITNRAKQFDIYMGLVYLGLIAVFRLLRLWQQHKNQLHETNMLIDGHSELPQDLRTMYKCDLAKKSADKFNNWFGAACGFYGLCVLFFLGLLIYLN